MIEALKQSIQEFYGTNIEESPDFGRIVNDKHFNRLNELLNVHQNHVIFGGNANATTRYIEPTILDSITSSSKIMQDEIFGPILPIITYDDFNEGSRYYSE